MSRTGLRLSQTTLSSLPGHVAVPRYNRGDLRAGILHIGVGNFHRAHQAVYLQRLFEAGHDHDWALVGAGVRPEDAVMRARLASQDWLYTMVELGPAGFSATVVGSIVDFVDIDPAPMISRMADPAIRIVSLTITEGGYFIAARTGGFDEDHPQVQADLRASTPHGVFGILAAALARRFDAGVAPFTVMSCDNLPQNGRAARQATVGFARLVDDTLAARIDAHVAFPNGMVDCIAPATTEARRAMVLDTCGVLDAAPVVCEPFRQWVIEDQFPAGRPRLEEVDVQFVADVAPHELMKLRILNGGHAAIAYAGALLGHTFVHEAMADPDIAAWLDALLTREVIPTLRPSAGIDYAAYRVTVMERFANPQIADTIARLCVDGSNRQPKFILPTITDAVAARRPIQGLALELALWCRFCAAPEAPGRPAVIDDPRADVLQARARAARTEPSAFLGIDEVFGPLGRNPTLVAAFASAFTRLGTDGTRAALRAYVWRERLG